MLIIIFITGLLSCAEGSHNSSDSHKAVKDHTEVVYFHGKQRCATCMAIEENTQEVVNTLFSNEVKNGELVFRIVDISTAEGEALADKYEVTWSSLFVNKWKDGNESSSDMTKFGFGNARNNPDKFKQGLADKIRQSLE